MKKLLGLTVAMVGALVVGAAAEATVGWKVFATGTQPSENGAYVSVSADVLAPKTLAVRASKAGRVSWNIICTRDNVTAAADEVVPVDVAHSTKCTLFGNAVTEDGGTLRLQLLRR